jgi:NADP-reducing hydrogenase subunit HndD
MIHRDPDKCELCGICEMECGMFAINILAKEVEFVAEICDHCGDCVSICPTGALSLVKDN